GEDVDPGELDEPRRVPAPRHGRRALVVAEASAVVDHDRQRDPARIERRRPDPSDEEPRPEPPTRRWMARIDVGETVLAVMDRRSGNGTTDAGARHAGERQRSGEETDRPSDQLGVFPTGSSTMKAAPPSGRFSPQRRPECSEMMP